MRPNYTFDLSSTPYPEVYRKQISEIYAKGDYRVVLGAPPSIEPGTVQSDPTIEGVATFSLADGLVIWAFRDYFQNADLFRAAKALISERIGFGEFRRIVKSI